MSASIPPLIFGEVLFDCFPDGSSVLGGAPFNVAWHLHGMGLAPLMISGVGNDEHGRQVLNTMHQWGMNAAAVQTISRYPTGQVSVSFNDGEPSYTIVPDQAYDHVDVDTLEKTLANSCHGLIYHGTLAMRTPQSKATLATLIHKHQLPTFVDVNLRAPWWTPQTVETAVANAKWVKLNQDELALITGQDIGSDAQLEQTAKTFYEAHNMMNILIVTLGEKGALCLSREGFVKGHPVTLNHLVDTVGAGDSFSAVMIAGIIKQWPLQVTLDRALAFAAKICQIRGATTMDKRFYEGLVEQ